MPRLGFDDLPHTPNERMVFLFVLGKVAVQETHLGQYESLRVVLFGPHEAIATTLGLTVPKMLLVAADEVIDLLRSSTAEMRAPLPFWIGMCLGLRQLILS
jgi:hypothetical protein